AIDPVRGTDDRARPSLQMTDHPGSDRFEIAREIELGHSFAIAGVRPKCLVRLRDHDAHDLHGSTGRGLCTLGNHFGGLSVWLCDPGHGWTLRLHLVGRLVLPQSLEGSL